MTNNRQPSAPGNLQSGTDRACTKPTGTRDCCFSPAASSARAYRRAGRQRPPPWCRSPADSTRSWGPAPRAPSYPPSWSPWRWRYPWLPCLASPPSLPPSSRTPRRPSSPQEAPPEGCMQARFLLHQRVVFLPEQIKG